MCMIGIHCKRLSSRTFGTSLLSVCSPTTTDDLQQIIIAFVQAVPVQTILFLKVKVLIRLANRLINLYLGTTCSYAWTRAIDLRLKNDHADFRG